MKIHEEKILTNLLLLKAGEAQAPPAIYSVYIVAKNKQANFATKIIDNIAKYN